MNETRQSLLLRAQTGETDAWKDLTDLYITSAGDSWTSDYAPPGYDFKNGNTGGSLYRVRMGDVRGREEYRTDLK